MILLNFKEHYISTGFILFKLNKFQYSMKTRMHTHIYIHTRAQTHVYIYIYIYIYTEFT